MKLFLFALQYVVPFGLFLFLVSQVEKMSLGKLVIIILLTLIAERMMTAYYKHRYPEDSVKSTWAS